MILLIDNYDSFTYNLAQYLGELGYPVAVHRNDEIDIPEIEKMKPDSIVISPGPGTPADAGISVDVIKHFAGRIPILGVCLGHQCVGAAFGGKIISAKSIVHGKVSDIFHDRKTVFAGLPNPVSATRYHSLVVSEKGLPDCLEITARTSDDEIMGLRHNKLKIEGIQFHPESILTKFGKRILSNYLQGGHMQLNMKEAINRVVAKKSLKETEAASVMDLIMNGDATPAQISAFLTGLRMKGETVAEITGCAKIMREKVTKINIPDSISVVDTCGTGGDGSNTFNISTTAAFVAAGAGVNIAKHGNRSVSSKCGSADLLKELGVNLDIDSKGMEKCIQKAGIGFLFAPVLHKAMKYAIGPRREMGIRTIFNILGPLSNPAFAEAQVMGVFSPKLTEPLAKVLKNLGVKRAFVVHGSDGMDEITITGKTKISELNNGKIDTYNFDPKKYGFKLCKQPDIVGGNPSDNAKITLAILKGEKGAKRDISIINAAFTIIASGLAGDVKEGIKKAAASIDSGKALKKLQALKRVSNQ